MHSMTGFGRAEHATDTLAARVEATSVNRKQGEVVVHLPRAYNELEASIRKTVLGKLSRGRVNISIQLEKPEGATNKIRINTVRARALEAAFVELSEVINRSVTATSADFLRTPEILEYDDQAIDIEAANQAIFPALESALSQMITMRAQEGKHLYEDTKSRISTLEKITQKVINHAPSVLTRYRENLQKRVAESG